MKYQPTKTKFGTAGQVRRQRWMRDFEQNVLALDYRYTGHIDWDTASHFFFSGKSPSDAAQQYVTIRHVVAANGEQS